ncbi:hypothetical protein FQN51_004816 [Onygenales sp. PD_10]|nr:hypothetical protein FQN51_004816 [Onygenales sp. PD_10]
MADPTADGSFAASEHNEDQFLESDYVQLRDYPGNLDYFWQVTSPAHEAQSVQAHAAALVGAAHHHQHCEEVEATSLGEEEEEEEGVGEGEEPWEEIEEGGEVGAGEGEEPWEGIEEEEEVGEGEGEGEEVDEP